MSEGPKTPTFSNWTFKCQIRLSYCWNMQDRLHPGILGLIWMQLRLKYKLILFFKKDIHLEESHLAADRPDRDITIKVDTSTV